MSAGDWLAAVGSVVLVLVVGALFAVLVLLLATLRGLRHTVDRLRVETVALLDEMRGVVREAGDEVERVDALVTAAERVEGRLDAAGRLVQRPVVKALALGTGTRRAVRSLRGDKQPSGRRRARRGA